NTPPPQRKTQLDATAIALLLACCLFWGFQQVLLKATLPEVPPLFQAALRFAGATVVLLVWCRARGVALRPVSADGHSLWRAGLLAGGLFAGEFACIYIGLQHTSASRLTVFLYTAPFWVALVLPWLVPSEKLRWVQWLGLGCAFAAVAFALREGFGPNQGLGWMGDLLAVAGGLLWGLTTVVIRSSPLARTSAELLLLFQIAVSAVLLSALSLTLGERWTLQFSTFAAVSLLTQTVVGAFASYLVWMWLLGRYPATRISVFAFLTPLFALVFGALWLDEQITPTLITSMVLVALGIVLVNRRA
ncbi:MAG: hypothetical protein RLZZ401_2035, partial [Pseudomonadota bacterium]